MDLLIKKCKHLEQFEVAERKEAESYECSECIKTGDRWVHLRTCQSCGITLCCDSSPNKHASKHAENLDHAIVISAEPGERWAWCYVDKVFLKF